MEKQKYAIGIRLKVTVFVCAVALIFVAIAITAGYRYSFRSLGLTAGENYRHMAELLAGTVNDIINNDVDLIKTNANAGVLKDAVRVSNARYQSDEKSTQRYLMDMDKKWIEMPAGHPLVKEYMENKASLSLQSFLEEYGKKVISIMATDKFGGLVAASSKTSDFYFGDKDWWKEAFGAGRGKILIGDIVFDEKANAWTLPFTVPIKDESGDIIGVCRILMNITAFFGPLEDFRIGRTGNAAMVDDKAYLVFYPNAKPFTNKFCEYGELQHILQSDRKWGRLDSAYLHGKGALAAFADVTHPLFVKKGIIWRVFVVQDANEVFSPLAAFILRMLLIGVIIVALLIIAGFHFSNIFIKPIQDVVDGIKRLETGDLDFRVKASGAGDEMEKLTSSFNEMAERLKSTASSAAKEKGELEKRGEELKKLEQLKSDFISALSQLQIGASIARQEVESVLDEVPSELNEKHKGIMKAADRNIDKLVNKMDNLIDITKIDTGKLDLKMRPVELKEIVKNIIFVYEPKIRDKGLALKIDMPKEGVCIYADPDRIKQVFANLLDNAVKFTDRGNIEISAKIVKDDVEFRVADTGPGIAREYINTVFERFQRGGRGAGGTEEEGLGLGLPIVKGIIELHSGTIRVESEPTRGTRFIFRLPKCEKA